MEESIENVKLVVHVAHNGHSFELACPSTTLIELVQTLLAPLACISRHDQLLVCDGTRLEPHKSLASYKLPDEERLVFLFNRMSLVGDAPPPALEEIQLTEPVLPSPPSSSLSSHPLEGASDPALKALPLYEKQFRYHHQKGHMIFDASHKKFEACRRLYREQQIQNLALDTAKKNMDHYYLIIDQIYTDFMEQHHRQQKQQADIMVNFEGDVERLRACKLHPVLISKNQNTLLDCLNVASLRKCAEACASAQKQFESKVIQLKTTYLELQRSVKELYGHVPPVDFSSLDRMIIECARIVEEENSIMQSLSKDVETVRKLVDDGASRYVSVSVRPHDVVTALGPMYDVHDKNHLPRMEACYQKLGRVLEYFRAKKHEMSVCVHSTMQKVASLQSTIRDVRNQLSALKEAMTRQLELFTEVKAVRRLGLAYRACLAEIVRRKSDTKIYMGQAGQLAERMARIREFEVARREEFLRVQSKYIPRDVLVTMGLFGIPSQCVVDIAPYDTNLLDLDMEDLEIYAPESILGLHLKASMGACDSSHGESTSEVSSVYLSSKNSNITNAASKNKPGVIEYVTSDEIAGTSKLEVENAWLKGELASAIALLCNIDPNFDPDVSTEEDVKGNAARKTMQALALKDEHAKHLQETLKTSQLQCRSYEKRIRELEQRLQDQYMELHKLSFEGVAMEAVCDNSLENRSVPCPPSPSSNGQFREGIDETMSDMSGALPAANMAARDAHGVEHSNGIQSENVSALNEQVASLREPLIKKDNDCAAVEERLRIALNDVDSLKRELQDSIGLLDECQINCAELENSLHSAREEARTKQCAADRKAAEYNSLRAASVRLRGLVERFRHVIASSPSRSPGFVESLQTFAASLGSNEPGDDGTLEFRACIRELAERVDSLVQQRAELLERCSLVEASKARLAAELEIKADLLKSQYAKRAHKGKICYTRFRVHELAMFMPNANGHYEAIHYGCPNHYLARESLALFRENFTAGQRFIIGQIVHIERCVAQLPAEKDNVSVESKGETCGSSVAASVLGCICIWNPYGLPFGTEYFVVSLAMVPEYLSVA